MSPKRSGAPRAQRSLVDLHVRVPFPRRRDVPPVSLGEVVQDAATRDPPTAITIA